MAQTNPLTMLTRCLNAIDHNSKLPSYPKTVKNGAVRPISASQKTQYDVVRAAVAAGNEPAVHSLKAHTAKFSAPIKQLANEYKRQLKDQGIDIFTGPDGKTRAINALTNMVVTLD